MRESRSIRQPVPGLGFWLLATLGVALTVPGVLVDADSGIRIALVVVGGVILGGLVGWVVDRAVRHIGVTGLQMKAAVAPGPYVPPIAGGRSETQEAKYNDLVQAIARLRFAFPTPKYRDYKTHVNHPRPSMGVQMPDGSVAYPDIVVVQHPENNTKIVAEVETSETVTEDAARYEWLPYADLAPLYLYVPVGKGDEAMALCRRHKIPVVGIRTWRYVVGYDQLEINDHFTVPSSPAELLPGILRSGPGRE